MKLLKLSDGKVNVKQGLFINYA